MLPMLPASPDPPPPPPPPATISGVLPLTTKLPPPPPPPIELGTGKSSAPPAPPTKRVSAVAVVEVKFGIHFGSESAAGSAAATECVCAALSAVDSNIVKTRGQDDCLLGCTIEVVTGLGGTGRQAKDVATQTVVNGWYSEKLQNACFIFICVL